MILEQCLWVKNLNCICDPDLACESFSAANKSVVNSYWNNKTCIAAAAAANYEGVITQASPSADFFKSGVFPTSIGGGKTRIRVG